ncbi:MAG: hypothetical protein WC961_05845 [Anaerovoracaceae bacterium]
MIAWKYIDKSAASIAAIRDYNAMRVIINNTPEEIKAVYEKMTAPRSPNLSGMPSVRNPQSGSDRLAFQIDKLDILRERYSQAIEYMTWFEPSWSSLTDTEQHILSEFYMGDNQKSGATYRLMDELNYSERKIEQMRSNALKHLRILLFG